MALFPLLKSVCVPIVDYSIAGVHDYNSLLHKIQAYTAVMETHLEELPPFLDYILFPLFHVLKAENKREDVSCLLYDAFAKVFQVVCPNELKFIELFSISLSWLRTNSEINLLHCARCIFVLINSNASYSCNITEKFKPQIGYYISRLIDICGLQYSKNTRQSSCEILFDLLDLYDKSTLINPRNVVSFVPGIVSTMHKIVMESNAGSTLTVFAMKSWSTLIKLVCKTFVEEAEGSSTFSNLIELLNDFSNGNSDSSLTSSKSFDILDRESLIKISITMNQGLKSDSWKIRREIANMSIVFIKYCTSIFPKSVLSWIEAILTLGLDAYSEVSKVAFDGIKEIITHLDTNKISLLNLSLQVNENLLQQIANLPKSVLSGKSVDGVFLFRSISSFMQLLFLMSSEIFVSFALRFVEPYTLKNFLKCLEIDTKSPNTRGLEKFIVIQDSIASEIDFYAYQELSFLLLDEDTKLLAKSFLGLLSSLLLHIEVCSTHNIKPQSVYGLSGTYNPSNCEKTCWSLFMGQLLQTLNNDNRYLKEHVLFTNWCIVGMQQGSYPKIDIFSSPHSIVLRDCTTYQSSILNEILSDFLLEYIDSGWLHLKTVVASEKPSSVEIEVAMNNSILLALIIRGMADIASLMKSNFQKHLMNCLYPLIEALGDSNNMVNNAAGASLVRIATICGYTNPAIPSLVAANIDYLIDKISFRARHFEIEDLGTPHMLHALLSRTGVGPEITILLGDTIHFVLNNIDILVGYESSHLVETQLNICLSILLSFVNILDNNKSDASRTTPNNFDDFNFEIILEEYARNLNFSISELRDVYIVSEEKFNPDDVPSDFSETQNDCVDLKPDIKSFVVKTREIIAKILHRVQFLFSHHKISQRYIVYQIAAACCRVLREDDNVLLPQVAKLWKTLQFRFSDFSAQNVNTVLFVTELFAVVSELAPKFLISHFQKEVWPAIKKLLINQIDVSLQIISNHGIDAFSATPHKKIQLSALKCIVTLLPYHDIIDPKINEILEVCSAYLNKINCSELKVLTEIIFDRANSDASYLLRLPAVEVLKLEHIVSTQLSVFKNGSLKYKIPSEFEARIANKLIL